MYAATTSATKENLMRTIRFETPDYIPMTFHINEACFDYYEPDVLFELMEQHPFLFPGFKKPAHFEKTYAVNARKDVPYTDDFGCVWKTSMNGIVGSVHDHPLSDWENYKNYKFPDPEKSNGLGPVNWNEFEKLCAKNRANGEILYGDLRHGHTFQQMVDLRGYEDLLCDMVDEEPLLDDLVEKLEAFNMAQIKHFLKADVDVVRIPEDLGMQTGPMIDYQNFVKYIKPSYQRLLKPVREAGKIIHMHSDGNLHVLIDEIIDGGVDIINLQDLVNGIDWIAGKFRGRVCVDLDIDRQSVTPYGTPEQIDTLIREEVEKVGCREGGLMMIYGLYPGVPVENVRAVMDAMERYAFYYR
mgnify:CR=1 FL=1